MRFIFHSRAILRLLITAVDDSEHRCSICSNKLAKLSIAGQGQGIATHLMIAIKEQAGILLNVNTYISLI